VIRSAQPNPGIPELIRYLKQEGYTTIIASDANTFFIGEIIEEHHIGGFFK
jgi:phosphoserine phosphatase